MQTILVVEDEMLIRLHVTDFFRDRGFHVLEASDGPAALDILNAEVPVHAVFSDITLPGEPDGLGLAQWIRKTRPELPVVLTSGKVTAEHLPFAKGEESLFFAKPCDYDEVAKRIWQLLQPSPA